MHNLPNHQTTLAWNPQGSLKSPMPRALFSTTQCHHGRFWEPSQGSYFDLTWREPRFESSCCSPLEELNIVDATLIGSITRASSWNDIAWLALTCWQPMSTRGTCGKMLQGAIKILRRAISRLGAAAFEVGWRQTLGQD